MSGNKTPITAGTSAVSGRDWLKSLAQYSRPDHLRSVFELIVTVVPFVTLWLAAWWALSISYWLTLAISVPAAGFLVRVFIIQHDCGHGAFFRSGFVNDLVGRILGVLTMTPYDVWRKSHAIHHATSGNLDRRGVGDIDTLTVREYRALPLMRRIGYRLYRHPLVMFGVGPVYLFLLRNRLPIGFMRTGWGWASAMGTTTAFVLVAGLIGYFVGVGPFLMVQIPIILLASSMGVWMFYVQHQFKDTVWVKDKGWKLHDAALYGSSHYDLPRVFAWITGNIGIHHVHHLSSLIPFYRLRQALRDFPDLARIQRITFVQSLVCVKLGLWDEDSQKLISFPEARAL